MSNAVQLSLFDLGPALPTAAAREADLLARIREKLDLDADYGLLGGEEYEADFPEDE